MSEEKQVRQHDVPAGGIFLIFLGVVFILQTLEVLPWTLWNTLWRFWPVLLINGGLSILLRRYNAWLVNLLLLATLLGCLALAVWQTDKPLPPGQGNVSYPTTSTIVLPT